jgi:anthranilate synthase/aminodeoxychorismate synthase-like glutamine amidotransferase
VILLIDNYDSFVFNLARYFQRLGQATHVIRNDETDVEQVRRLAPDAIILSPGPCTPDEAGCSLELVRELWQEFPMLGVCLGHQVIAAAFGAKIVRAPQPMHGRTSEIAHGETGIYESIVSPLTVCRYHSLVVDLDSMPTELNVTSRTVGGVVMGIQHRSAPIFGMQFHPEAILTESGFALLTNFLWLAGIDAGEIPATNLERVVSSDSRQPLPTIPVTF